MTEITCQAINDFGVTICRAQWFSIDNEKGYWLGATKWLPGALIRYYDLEAMISEWLNSPENEIRSIEYDTVGHHNTSYPDRVIANEKARLVVKELTR